MALAVLRHHPKRIIPVVCADRKCLLPERKFRTDILSRPKRPPTLRKDEPGQVLDGTTECSKSHGRHSKADPFVVFLRSHHQDAKHVFEEATNALYNLDFNTAERDYETLTRDYPDNPDYWNALAASIWLHIMYDQQKLNVESFSGSSLGTKDSRDTVNPADEKRLRDSLAKDLNLIIDRELRNKAIITEKSEEKYALEQDAAVGSLSPRKRQRLEDLEKEIGELSKAGPGLSILFLLRRGGGGLPSAVTVRSGAPSATS